MLKPLIGNSLCFILLSFFLWVLSLLEQSFHTIHCGSPKPLHFPGFPSTPCGVKGTDLFSSASRPDICILHTVGCPYEFMFIWFLAKSSTALPIEKSMFLHLFWFEGGGYKIIKHCPVTIRIVNDKIWIDHRESLLPKKHFLYLLLLDH